MNIRYPIYEGVYRILTFQLDKSDCLGQLSRFLPLESPMDQYRALPKRYEYLVDLP